MSEEKICQCEEFATLSSEYEKLAAIVSNISCILSTAKQCNAFNKLNSKVDNLEKEIEQIKAELLAKNNRQ